MLWTIWIQWDIVLKLILSISFKKFLSTTTRKILITCMAFFVFLLDSWGLELTKDIVLQLRECNSGFSE